VLIRRHIPAEHHQRLVAIAFFDVPKHLVGGPVLLDDENYVLDRGRLACARRNRDRLARRSHRRDLLHGAVGEGIDRGEISSRIDF